MRMDDDKVGNAQVPDKAQLAALEMVLENRIRRRFMREALLRWQSHNQPVSPSEAAVALGLPVDQVAYHVRCCVECGAITLSTTKSHRGATKHFYRPSALLLSVEWLVIALIGAGG
jgi:predicted transcriptional regulator